MVRVVWTEIAIEDLRLIHEYISKDSKHYADRFIEKLIERVDQLERFPKAGRVVPEFDTKIIRELIEGNYRLVYKISPDQISIIRVHHSARQLK
ncbi:MAG: type II toxin-antitoxin system RelE/ParE family toxin [Ferruginibacter sp.]